MVELRVAEIRFDGVMGSTFPLVRGRFGFEFQSADQKENLLKIQDMKKWRKSNSSISRETAGSGCKHETSRHS